MTMLRTAVLLTATAAATACGDGSGPATVSMAEVAGVYQATTLTLENTEGFFDELARGGSINLTLTTQGNTTGRLFVAGGNADGSDFEADLTGTWELEGPVVRLDHPSDSFLRDIGLLYDRGTLAGEQNTVGATISVVLTRIDP